MGFIIRCRTNWKFQGITLSSFLFFVVKKVTKNETRVEIIYYVIDHIYFIYSNYSGIIVKITVLQSNFMIYALQSISVDRHTPSKDA